VTTTILWRINVQRGRENEFEALTRQLVHDVHANEPGQVFEYRKTQTDPPVYVLFMSFSDPEAFERYSNADYHTSASAAIMACIEGSPVAERLDSF
jgi:quinol monooxygenase YgiN